MLEENTWRIIMLIGGVVVCALVITLFGAHFKEIKDVFNQLTDMRISKF